MNLSETTLLLTRPQPAAARFQRQVETALGNFRQVLISPLMRIVPLECPDLTATHEEVLFSSENGVAAFAGLPVAGRRAWCVGARTAEKARALGFEVRHVVGTSAELADLLIEERPNAALVHVAGRHRRDDLAARLGAAGLSARTLVAYDQQSQPLTAPARALLDRQGDVVAPLFSPRSARLLSEAAADRRARLAAVAISAAVAREWRASPGETVEVAPTPDAAGVIVAMGSLFDADPSA